MGQIYRSAAHVLVCLGEEDDDAEYSFAIMSQLWDYYFSDTEQIPADQRLSTRGFASFPGIHSERFAESLTALACRSYFERVWIVQELLLARDLTMCCRYYQLPIRYPHTDLILRAAAAYKVQAHDMIAKQQDRKCEKDDGALDMNWAGQVKTRNWKDARILRLLEQRWHLSERGQTPCFLDALKLFSLRRCQNPIDRVYGTLTLIGWKGAELVEPDYSKSKYDVAIECIARTHVPTKLAFDIGWEDIRQILESVHVHTWEFDSIDHSLLDVELQTHQKEDYSYKMFVFDRSLE